MKSEAKIQSEILLDLGAREDLRLWRMNNGLAIPMAEYKAAMKEGREPRYVRYGIPGQADILGIGTGGKFVAIEVKTPKGRLRESQKVFQRAIESLGGIYIIGTSAAQVSEELRESGDSELSKGDDSA